MARNNAHRYDLCRDPECQRVACQAYRDGRERGYEDGYEDGFTAGFAAGSAAVGGDR